VSSCEDLDHSRPHRRTQPEKPGVIIALITRASSGIGLDLPRLKLRLILTGRNQTSLEKIAKELQNTPDVLPACQGCVDDWPWCWSHSISPS